MSGPIGARPIAWEEANVSVADAGHLHPGTADHGACSETAPAPLPPKETLTAAGEILRALAAPVRIAIVLQLRESQRCVQNSSPHSGHPATDQSALTRTESRRRRARRAQRT